MLNNFPLSKRFVFIYVVIVAILLLGNNAFLSYWDQDEPSYAGFAYQMKTSGNFVTPTFTWGEPHRKTPMHFWTIAASYTIFGVNEFAVRFPSALAVLLTGWLIFYLGKKFWGENVSLLAGLVTISSVLLFSLGKIAVTDALLLCFETLAILSLFHWISLPNWPSLVGLWIGIAGALLVKGPPVLMLCGVTGAVLFIFHPTKTRFFNPILWLTGVLGLVPLLVWGRLSWLQDDGAFITFLLDHYIINRAKGGTFANQTGPPGYYMVIFMLSFIFWIPFVWKGLANVIAQIFSLRKRPFSYEENASVILLFAWFVGGWWLYEPIKSKLPAYAIGAYPAVAILIAKTILDTKNSTSGLKWGWGIYFFFWILVGVTFPVAYYLLLEPSTLWITVPFSLIIYGMALITFRYWQSKPLAQSLGMNLIFSLVFLGLGWYIMVPMLEEKRSITLKTAKIISSELPTNTTIVLPEHYALPSLPMYLTTKGYPYIFNRMNSEQIDSVLIQPKTAVVLNDALYDQWKSTTSLKPSNFNTYSVEGWALDMAKTAHYFVVTQKTHPKPIN